MVLPFVMASSVILNGIIENSSVNNNQCLDILFQDYLTYVTNGNILKLFSVYIAGGPETRSDILNTLLVSINKEYSVIVNNYTQNYNELKPSSMDSNKINLIILTNIYEVDIMIDQIVAFESWNFLAPLLCIITTPYDNNKHNLIAENLVKTFESFLKHSIRNVHILVTHYNIDFMAIYTWFPYAEGNDCGRRVNITETFSECNYGLEDKFKRHASVRKMPNDFQKCLINVSFVQWEPFSYVDEQTKRIKGIEVDLVNLVTDKLNLKVDFSLENKSRFDLSIYNKLLNR